MRRLLFLSGLPVLATVSSCLGPTEVMVDITTNACDTLSRVDVYVGNATAPVTSTPGCATPTTTEVGTVAVLPSGAVDGHLDLTIVGALGAATCSTRNTSDQGCIVANRSLSFAPHRRLDLPIFLDSQCAGHPCLTDETCVVQNGVPVCLKSTCDETGGVTCEGDAGAPIDSGPIDDTSPIKDVVTGCPLLVTQGTPTFLWSFQSPDDTQVHEDADATPAQPLTGASFSTAPPLYCSQYLVPKNPQTIAGGDSKFATRSFTLAFAYRATGDGTVMRLDTFTQQGGFIITIEGGALAVYFMTIAQTKIFADNGKSADGAFHTFVMDVATLTDDAGALTSAVKITRDGVATGFVAPVAYRSASAGLIVGPIDAIDQVEFYAH